MYLSPIRERMPSLKYQIKRSAIQEQIVEVNKKIHLLEGSKKAFLEKVSWSVQKNNKLILEMREENKNLHKLLNEILTDDSFLVKKAFRNHKKHEPTFQIYSSSVAVVFMEEKLLKNIKKLNALKGMSFSFKSQISDLETQYSSMVLEAADLLKMEKDANKIIRQLENKLDKAKLKFHEAIHIRSIYQNVLVALYQESFEYKDILLQQQSKTIANKKELKNIQSMYEEAQNSRDYIKEDLLNREENLQAKRFEHEETINQLHEQEKEEIVHHEKIEKKLKRLLLQETILYEELKRPRISVEMRKQQLADLEERFSVIYKTLGICGPEQMVKAFRFQRQAKNHLLLLKQSNLIKISKMKEKKKKLIQECDAIKYSKKSDSSRWKSLVNNSHQQLKDNIEERNKTAYKLACHQQFLANLKIALQHLVDIVQYIDKGEFQSDFEVIGELAELLHNFEQKILKLHDESTEQIEAGEMHTIESDRYYALLEKLFPKSNVRVLPPSSRKVTVYEAHDQKHDDVNMPSRIEMKLESQRIVELHMKRRTKYK